MKRGFLLSNTKVAGFILTKAEVKVVEQTKLHLNLMKTAGYPAVACLREVFKTNNNMDNESRLRIKRLMSMGVLEEKGLRYEVQTDHVILL